MEGKLQVGVLADRHYLDRPQPVGMCFELRAQMHRVVLLDPMTLCEQDDGWLRDLDVVVARGGTLALLALLAAAESRGVTVINRPTAIAAVRNTAQMLAALAARDVPTARTFVTPASAMAERLPTSIYPVLVRPTRASDQRRPQIVRNADELARIDWVEAQAFIQQIPPGGRMVRLCGVGERIWAIRGPNPSWLPAIGTHVPGGLRHHEPSLHELGARCGGLFGLELFEVQCLVTADGPLVLGMTDFSDYSGVVDADRSLADYVVRRVRQEQSA